MAETFPITIMGQKFLLKGNFEKEYIQQVESYINQKIEKIKKIMEDVEKNTNHLMKIIESRI